VVAKQLGNWRDPVLLTRGLLLCAMTLDTPLEQLLPEAKSAPVADLWKTIAQIEKRRANPKLLDERLALEFTKARGHWLLRRDDRRSASIRELLELDYVPFVAVKGGDGKGGGSGAPPPSGPPPDPGGPGSGGSDGSGGSGSGGSSGGDSGGTDPGGPIDGGKGGGTGGLGGVPGQRRGKPDTARFELDLRQWLEDFPLFVPSEPFGR
jgi:hypothetical protein